MRRFFCGLTLRHYISFKKKGLFAAGLFLGLMGIFAGRGEAKTVVTTTGYVTDAVQSVAGEFFDVEGLMGPGVDPHLYKASEGDVQRLMRADVIFYNGLHLEAKMIGIFEKMSRRIRTVAVAEAIPSEALLASVNYPDQHDPHVWFDVPLWSRVVDNIARVCQEEAPEHAEAIQKKNEAVQDRLKQLHAYVVQRSEELPKDKRILVSAHDAFRYFGRRYGFQVVGLQGISTQAEAGAADVRRLADFIVENRVRAIFIESSVPERFIRAVQAAVKDRGWDVAIGGELFSDALGDAGTPEGTYEGVIRHNIDTIVDALKGDGGR